MNCPICDGEMRMMLELPKFPLTEKYEPWSPIFEEGRGVADQAFHFCEKCSHGRLENVLHGLYGDDYRTKTQASAGASQAVSNFAAFIKANSEPRRIHIDIGGNDGAMKSHFHGVLVVDPNATEGIRETIENAELGAFGDLPKIIMSSHTIEHLERPEVLIGKAAQIMGGNDYFAMQFPSLELLIDDARIDQIHHQHIHYFSQKSASTMLYRHGLTPIAWRFDPSHWGALMVIARKGVGAIAGRVIPRDDIEYAYESFISNIGAIEIPYGAVAYGASLMFPVLSYWVPDLSRVLVIADDDAGKDGLRYINFDKRIANRVELEGRDVVITGISTKAAARSLTLNAIQAGAKSIILPLHTL